MRPDQLSILLLLFPVFIFSLTIHEFAHAWIAFKGGDDTASLQGRMTINPIPHIDPIGTVLFPLISMTGRSPVPLLGWAKPVPVNPTRLRHSRWLVWISIAGPISNLLIALCLVIIGKLFGLAAGHGSFLTAVAGIGNKQLREAAYILVTYGIQLNLALAIFNMIPIPPLDGSKVLFYFVIAPRQHLYDFWGKLEQFGFFIIYALIVIPYTAGALRQAIMIPYDLARTFLA